MPDKTEKPPVDRRAFFREALASLLNPLADAVEGRIRAAIEPVRAFIEPAEELLGAPIRPPGAVGEAQLAKLCNRCGDCAAACPVSAIVNDPFPHIVPARQPCLMCPGLPCIKACKTGALKQPADPAAARIGQAVWEAGYCRNGPHSPCDECAQACAVRAISITPGRVLVSPQTCNGCGECEQKCPARPRAIHVEGRRLV